MGGVALQQPDAGAGRRDDLVPLERGFPGPLATVERVGGPAVGQQFPHRCGGGHRQQEPAAGPQGRQPVGGLQQEGHPHQQLGPLRAGQQGHPVAGREGVVLAGQGGKIGHQVTHHRGPLPPAGGQPSGGGGPHHGDAVVPAGPARHPLGVGEVAVAQAGGEQHGPELVAAQEHHHPPRRPGAVAAGPQQQPPEPGGRQHPLEQPPVPGDPLLGSGGVGAGDQHQPQGRRGCRRWSCSARGRTQVLSSPGPLLTSTIALAAGGAETGDGWVKRTAGSGGREREMRMARLELARPKPHAPQTCVSTNSTTSAWSALAEALTDSAIYAQASPPPATPQQGRCR
jgi:hypothetical protein